MNEKSANKTPVNKKLAKRFYDTVSSRTSRAPSTQGFEILLDGRVLKTPGKIPLILRDAHMASLVVREWDAQSGVINPVVMPVTRLTNVAVEQAPKRREELIKEARNYAGTDLLCYRADHPVDLAQRQETSWSPVLRWAASQGVSLETTRTVQAIAQNEPSLDAVADYARTLDNFDLTLFVHLIAVYGSAVLGFAVMKGQLTGEAAFLLSRLDEVWQNEQWGEDAEAKERAESLRLEIVSLCRILEE